MSLEHHLHQLDLGDDLASAVSELCTGQRDPEGYEAVQRLIKSSYHTPSHQSQVLEACNEILEGHGVEALTGEYLDSPHGNIQACYINMGDSYLPTLIWDCMEERWSVDCVADFVSNRPERFPSFSSNS